MATKKDTRMIRRAKAVCWVPAWSKTANLLPPHEPELHALDLALATEAEAALEALGEPGDAVLLLVGWSTEGVELVSRLRGDAAWSGLPVFAAIPHEEVVPDLQARANDLQVEILSLPMPANRLWTGLREALNKYRAKCYHFMRNRRRYFRVPLSATAYCPVASRTVDISGGGVQFLTGHAYHKGDRGLLDIPALRETLQRALPFEVVAVDSLSRGEFPYRIRAKFVDLESGLVKKIGVAISALDAGGPI